MNSVRQSTNLDPQISLSERQREEEWKSRFAKIWNVASKIFFVLMHTLCYAMNPTLYCIAFVAGVIYCHQVHELVQKVQSWCRRNPWPSLTIAGVAGFLCIQVAWASVSVLFAAHLGAALSQNEEKILNQSPTVIT